MNRKSMREKLFRWGDETRRTKEIEEKINAYKILIDSLYGVKTQELSGMPHGSGVSDPTLNTAERNEERVAAYNERIDDLSNELRNMLSECKLIGDMVKKLPPVQSSIINLRFVRMGTSKKDTWEKIARLSGYVEDYARRIERDALDNLIKMYGERK